MQHRFICFIHVAVGNGAASHCFSAASPLHVLLHQVARRASLNLLNIAENR
jgi:hypothetical protein